MNLENKIIHLIKDNLEDKTKEVTPESHLVNDLDIDSFAKVMLLNDIQDEFDLKINEEELNNVLLVKDIITKISNVYIGA